MLQEIRNALPDQSSWAGALGVIARRKVRSWSLSQINLAASISAICFQTFRRFHMPSVPRITRTPLAPLWRAWASAQTISFLSIRLSTSYVSNSNPFPYFPQPPFRFFQVLSGSQDPGGADPGCAASGSVHGFAHRYAAGSDFGAA